MSDLFVSVGLVLAVTGELALATDHIRGAAVGSDFYLQVGRRLLAAGVGVLLTARLLSTVAGLAGG